MTVIYYKSRGYIRSNRKQRERKRKARFKHKRKRSVNGDHKKTILCKFLISAKMWEREKTVLRFCGKHITVCQFIHVLFLYQRK